MSDKRWAIFKPDGRVICFHPTQDAADDAIGVCRQLGIEGCTVRHCRIGDTDEAYALGWRDALAAAAAVADECTHGDDLLRGLGRAIAALTPPG